MVRRIDGLINADEEGGEKRRGFSHKVHEDYKEKIISCGEREAREDNLSYRRAIAKRYLASSKAVLPSDSLLLH